VPPCTSSASDGSQQQANRSLALPAKSKTKSVTAPPCSVPSGSSSSS
jgi:hypothetical protein